MRIISGEFRGMSIHPPANLPVRPTTDFAKTGLFNILMNHFDFENTAVLDLFCGSGSISYEFVSRGCRNITSVDVQSQCIRFVKETMKRLGVNAQVIRTDAFRYLRKTSDKFDIIFADPPFDESETGVIPRLVNEQALLNEKGWLIVEHQSKRRLDSAWQPSEIRIYGNCAFSIFRGLPKPG